MKFQKPQYSEPWSKEKTEERMAEIMSHIQQINRGIEKSRKKISGINNDIRVLSGRLSNKQKYYNQLKKQLDES